MVQPGQRLWFYWTRRWGKDVFVHMSALETAGIDNLNEGDVVSFEVVSENGKEKASDLKIV